MKKKLALIVPVLLPVLLIGATSVMADDSGLTPYVGLDAQLRHMSYKSGFGGNLFNHNYPQGNVYVGLKFNNCIGIEVGFTGGPKRSRDTVLQFGDVNLGTALNTPLDAIFAPIVYNTSTKVSSLHADIIGFYPLGCDIQLYGSVGASRLRARFTRASVAFSGGSLLGTDSAIPEKFARSKTVLRLGIGLQQMLTCNVGIRGGINWENTSKLNNITAPISVIPDGSFQPVIKLKDSFTYNLGVFWQF